MEGGLLSLKWNNHRSTFFHVLSNVRNKKDSYADATLACEGKFYPVHKLVLSSCSEYFEEMFEHAGKAQCKHPFIVLKDIKCDELECLLSYMYVGEVNVVQEKLSGLIKAAECLRIKGLAVPDEEPTNSTREKRASDDSLNSEPKRRRQEDFNNSSSSNFRQTINRNEERRKSSSDQSPSKKLKNSVNSNLDNILSGESSKESSGNISDQEQHEHEVKTENLHQETETPEEVLLDEPEANVIKIEPSDMDTMYLSDSNSMTENKEHILMDGYGDASADNQQHFMDELLGNASDSRQMVNLSDFMEGSRCEPSRSAGGNQHTQPMVNSHDLLYNIESSENAVVPFEELNLPRATSFAGINNAHQTTIAVNHPSLSVVPFHELKLSEGVLHDCPHCSKRFHGITSFKRHYMSHSGEKPYGCKHCPYRTNDQGNLSRHFKKCLLRQNVIY